ANRARPRHRGADRRTDEACLRNRGVAHALGAELVDKALGRAERAEHDVLAHQEGQRIAFHFFGDGLVYRLDKTDLRHDDTSERGCSGDVVNIVGDFRRRGQFARACEFDRVGEFLFGFGDDLREFGRAYLAALRAPLLESNQRAFELPFLDFGLLAIRAAAKKGLFADDVPLPSIGLAFEQGGTFAGAGACDGLAGVAKDFEHVVAIDDMAGNVVGLGAHGDVFDRGYGRHRSELAEAVVLAYEDDRQLP